jgi:hypothetical protein
MLYIPEDGETEVELCRVVMDANYLKFKIVSNSFNYISTYITSTTLLSGAKTSVPFAG